MNDSFRKEPDAGKPHVRIFCEGRTTVRGASTRPKQPMRVNYFIGILGETLQRMDDPDARYSIAFPDMRQYRGLWERLPQLAKERTTIDMLLIDSKGNIEVYK